MYRTIYFLLIVFILLINSEFNINCPNGRPAFYTMNMLNFSFSAHCITPGQLCSDKRGKCTKQNLCCPPTLKMSSKSRLYDQLTNIRYNRLGNDYNNTYRLFELNLLSNKFKSNNDNEDRWKFFEHTLRDLFEMPNGRFWYSIKNCMENHGNAFVFIPLNATSVTANISAITIITRNTNSMNNIYICYMATRKEHRRRGLATRLLQQIVYRALNQPIIESITLNVNTLNTVALQFYEKCGWRCYAYLPRYLDLEPHHATNHAYALVLRLDKIKNVTNLCKESNAVEIDLSDNEQSIKNCGRIPLSF